MTEVISAKCINISVYHISSPEKSKTVSNMPHVLEMLKEHFKRYSDCFLFIKNYTYSGVNPVFGRGSDIEVYEIRGKVFIYFQAVGSRITVYQNPIESYSNVMYRIYNRAKFRTVVVEKKK